MARITQKTASQIAAEELAEEEKPYPWESVYYLGAHPQYGWGKKGTPFQPQAAVFPGQVVEQEREFTFDPEVMEIDPSPPGPPPPVARTDPRYEPAYGPSPTMGRALDTARAQEGGLNPAGEFAYGLGAGAIGGYGEMMGAQAQSALGIVDDENTAVLEDWRDSLIEQEDEIERLLSDDPTLWESVNREVSDVLGLFTSDEDAPPAKEEAPPKGATRIRREPPTSPGEAGEAMGEAVAKGIAAEPGLMVSDLESYGRAYPLATLLTLSPDVLAKLTKLPGVTTKTIKAAQKRAKKLLGEMSAANAKKLAKATEKALRKARNSDEVDAAFRALEESTGADLSRARRSATNPSPKRLLNDEMESLVDQMVPEGGSTITAASHAAVEKLRKALDLPPAARSKKGASLHAALEKAKGLLHIADDGARISPTDELSAALKAARAGKRILTAEEQFAALLQVKFISKKKEKLLTGFLEDMGGAPATQTARAEYDQGLTALLDQQEALLGALDESGSQWSAAGRGRQVFLEMFDELTDTKVLEMATALRGKPLTKGQVGKIKKKFVEASKKKTEAREALEKIEKRLDDIDKSEDALSDALPGAGRRKAQGAINKERKALQDAQAKAAQKAAEGASAEVGAARVGFWSGWADWMGASRALQASMDVSAFGRQAVQMFKEHPIITGKAVLKSLRAAFSPKYAMKLQKEIMESGFAKYADRSGLYIADLQGVRGMSGRAGGITSGEEAFVNNMLQDKGILTGLLNISERNYSTILNQARFEILDRWTRVGKGGVIPKGSYAGDIVWTPGPNGTSVARVSMEDAEKLATILNYSTGRGDLSKLAVGKKMEKVLNTVFFAPRFAASRLQSPVTDLVDVVLGTGNVLRGKPMTHAQKVQMIRLVKQQSANAAINVAATAMLDTIPWEESMSGYFDPRDPRFLSVKITGPDSDWIIDTSGGIASTWRYLPGLYDLAFGEGETISPKVDRLIANKVVGPISAIGQVLTNRGFRGEKLWAETASAIEVGFAVLKKAAVLGVPISIQEVTDQLTVYSDSKGLQFTDAEISTALAPAILNFIGLSNYERVRE